MSKPKVGQRVAVQVYHSRTGKVEIENGTVEAVTGALDRPYRVDVRPDQPGRFWQGCAPECVEPVSAA